MFRTSASPARISLIVVAALGALFTVSSAKPALAASSAREALGVSVTVSPSCRVDTTWLHAALNQPEGALPVDLAQRVLGSGCNPSAYSVEAAVPQVNTLQASASVASGAHDVLLAIEF